MTSDESRFYSLRDRRTITYGASEAALDRGVGLVAEGAAADSGSAQVALLALANMLARVHRRVAVSLPPVPLAKPSIFGTSASLRDAIVETMLAVNPCLDLQLRAPTADEPALGIGDTPAALHLGFSESTALVSREPQPVIGGGRRTLFGAATAACLGASELYRMVHGQGLRSSSLSLLESLGDGPQLPPDLPALDAGDVAVVGAGAVSAAMAYWLHHIGHVGTWLVVDGDIVKLHNTNRSLAFRAQDAGWPSGPARRKVDIVASLLGARAIPMWYDEWVAMEPYAEPDLVLPLANERGVREAVNQRALPVVLHATTSRAWQAQLHRHIAGLDDCIGCRFPTAAPQFECSSAPALVQTEEGGGEDAALPFLSAAAGLLLIVGLYQLAFAGSPVSLPTHNLWWLSFDGGRRLVTGARAACRPSCAAPAPELVRRLSGGNRWRRLVHAAQVPPGVSPA